MSIVNEDGFWVTRRFVCHDHCSEMVDYETKSVFGAITKTKVCAWCKR